MNEKQVIQHSCLIELPHILDVICVWQLDIVKFALPLEKIFILMIFSVGGKHTNFFMSDRAVSRPFLICVQRLTTSAYKPARLGKSLLLGLSRRSGQTYPLVAKQVASHP